MSTGLVSPDLKHQTSASCGQSPYSQTPATAPKERVLSITIDTVDDDDDEELKEDDPVCGHGSEEEEEEKPKGRERSESQDYANVLHLLVGHGFYSRTSWNSFQQLRKFQKSNNIQDACSNSNIF